MRLIIVNYTNEKFSKTTACKTYAGYSKRITHIYSSYFILSIYEYKDFRLLVG